MTVLEAQTFLATKRATRGRPDRAWMDKKVEALKTLKDAGLSTEVEKTSVEETSSETDVIAFDPTPIPEIVAALEKLSGPSPETEW